MKRNLLPTFLPVFFLLLPLCVFVSEPLAFGEEEGEKQDVEEPRRSGEEEFQEAIRARSNRFELRVRGEAWYSRIQGDFRSDTSLTQGTRVDLDDDLDIDSWETAPGIHAEIRWGGTRLHGRYFEMEHKGDNELTREIRFKGKTFTVTERVESEFRLERFELYVEQPIPWVGTERVRLEGLAGVSWVKFKGVLQSSRERNKEEFDTPVPEVGLAVRGTFPGFDLYAGGKGWRSNSGDIDGTFFDGGAWIDCHWDRLTFQVGYRVLAIDAEVEDTDVDFVYHGPFVSAGFRF